MERSVFNKLLKFGVDRGASDIHFEVGSPPCYRIRGDLLKAKYEALTPEATLALAQLLLGDRQVSLDRIFAEQDTSYSLPGVSRFRVSIFRQRGTVGCVLRVIPFDVRSFGQLNLPEVLAEVANARRGLILVTGATGNGKSTTIAAMVNHINDTRQCHVVTIEDPIEFLFENKRAMIIQREVGTDTHSYNDAMIAALRQDPDVVMLGEVRDTVTANVVLKAAETGHLLITTLHTPDAPSTIKRFTGFFEGQQYESQLARFADCLQAVVSLRLVPKADGTGVTPAVEILRVTHTLQECIRAPDKHGEILDHIAKGRDMYQMQTFDQHLSDLVAAKAITLENAKLHATRPADLERSMMME